MRNALRTALSILVVGHLSLGLSSAHAGPFDFLRKIGNSIAHPRHQQRKPAPSPSKGNNASTTVKRNDFRPPELKEPEPTESPSTRAAQSASSMTPAGRSRTDLPYGVPVPSKPGFVISPYSPNSGYVDIRGFPNGTEVKDPYTGKVFLTP